MLNIIEDNQSNNLLFESSSKQKDLCSYHNHIQSNESSMSYTKTVKCWKKIVSPMAAKSIQDQENQQPGRLEDFQVTLQPVEGDKKKP